ncbi:MAG: hypothetical protein K9G67_02250 [Bacteroidales bacterium]|nr:hypothetical protein [Bacteroidales bacterium]MCF8344871.1 hypothetical protein [Bacteroidales bacterium]MCF8351755.1 hypothetical protein [Bacteroidales bacterium]MCF8375153.1 hypothetical protein [Bacteroidales bacterium]MCF8401854.1 hypothetical protein [Bacteroidales bacterium]
MNSKTKKINRLLKAKYEGRISREEETELERLLASDKSAAEHQELLEKLEADLHEPDQTEAQVDVSEAVMQKIGGGKSSSHQKKSFNIRSVNALTYRYAALLIIGLLLGAAVSWVWLTGRQQANVDQLQGSMINASDGLYYMQAGTSIKMVPYVAEDLYYLNFFIDARNEIEIETTFSDQYYQPVKMEYIISGGRRNMDNLDGEISFVAHGITQFQIILKRTTERTSSVYIKATQNQNVLTSKQIF